MLIRLAYNIIIYLILKKLAPYSEINGHTLQVIFAVWSLVIFNIAISGGNRLKHLWVSAIFVYGPFVLASTLTNLIGGVDNLYNYYADIWCEGHRANHSYYFGYWYMGITFLISAIWRLADKSESRHKVRLQEWIKSKL